MGTPRIQRIQTGVHTQSGARAIERVLVELLALERELCELDYMRRSDALERAGDAVRALGELGPSDRILARAASEFGLRSQFDRVLISEVADDRVQPLALWAAGQDEQLSAGVIERLRKLPISLAYPLIEAEVARHHEVTLVHVGDGRGRAPEQLVGELELDRYVVGALTARGETIGLLHADAQHTGRELDELDAEVVATFTQGLSGVLERAVLRHTLELHRAELQSAVQWMSARLARLSDIDTPSTSTDGGRQVADSLTSRELEVVRLLARGNTNQEIAAALVVREGTVKYHVKNILRKLGATSRADAVARFVRSSGPAVTR